MSIDVSLQSPLHKLPVLSKELQVDLWVKRDDLIPSYLGGNKVRKNISIIDEHCSKVSKPDIIITNGGAQSNHARVVALIGAALGIEVHLVLHGSPSESLFLNGNEFFYHAAKACVHYVPVSEIQEKINAISEEEEKSGKRVLVIPGGGHSVAGARAYSAAVSELSFEPDYIVHASGTGGTQAGIATGIADQGFSSKLIGISIARRNPRGYEAVDELLRKLRKCVEASNPQDYVFEDSYTFGGYGSYDAQLVEFIEYIARKEGLPLDPVYTGKAFFGLVDLIKKGVIPVHSKVIFWHTGGLLNLQSAKRS